MNYALITTGVWNYAFKFNALFKIYALMSSRRVADIPYVMCFRLQIAFNLRVIIHRYVPRLATEHEVNLSQFELFPTSSSF